MLRQPRDGGCAGGGLEGAIRQPRQCPGLCGICRSYRRPSCTGGRWDGDTNGSTEAGELGPRNWIVGTVEREGGWERWERWERSGRARTERVDLPLQCHQPAGSFLFFCHRNLVFLGVALADVASTQQDNAVATLDWRDGMTQRFAALLAGTRNKVWLGRGSFQAAGQLTFAGPSGCLRSSFVEWALLFVLP